MIPKAFFAAIDKDLRLQSVVNVVFLALAPIFERGGDLHSECALVSTSLMEVYEADSLRLVGPLHTGELVLADFDAEVVGHVLLYVCIETSCLTILRCKHIIGLSDNRRTCI